MARMRPGNHDLVEPRSFLPYVRVANAIRVRLDAGEWPPGSALPPLSQLAQELGVSKSTVARAVRLLADEGRLIRVPSYGIFVPE